MFGCQPRSLVKDDELTMNNFGRVLKLAARRRFALVGILCTSLVIAVLWGANIGTLYPLVEVVFKGDSLPSYVESRVNQSEAEVAELDHEISLVEQSLQQAAGEEKTALQIQMQSLETRRNVTSESGAWFARVKPWVDAYAPDGPYATLILVVAVLVGGTALKLVALMINMLLVQYVAERTAFDLRSTFFRKSLSLDLDAFGENGSAELTSRLTNDVSRIYRIVRPAGPNGTRTIENGCLSRRSDVHLLAVAAAGDDCHAGGCLGHDLFEQGHQALSRRAMEEMSQLYGMLSDAFSGIRVVKAFNAQAYERAKFRRGTHAFYLKSMKIHFYNMLARSSSEMLGMATVGLAILAGGYLVVNQETQLLGLRMSQVPLNVGEVLMFFGFLIGASDPARKLTDVWSGLQRGVAATTRLYAVIDQKVRVQEPSDPQSVPRPHRDITFQDVCYHYSSGPKVLDGMNFKIAHGETIAVVGPNGSGKSTLVSLLCRFDDPQSGMILVDDVPLMEMRTRDVRRRIALVTQRTALFEDTIENNIRYGTPGADSHAVVRAAKMAFADDFIRTKTPNGYQTRLGSGGVQLSGGQMQRIALARAFLRDPDILILDEATSQIDMESELLIHKALKKFLVNRTGLMITHRASSLVMADRTIVVEAGQVADQGTHEELQQRNDFYRNLCGDQRLSA